MVELTIQEIVSIVGNKELVIITKDKEIQILQARIKSLEDKYIKSLEDKYEPKPVESKLKEVKKEKQDG